MNATETFEIDPFIAALCVLAQNPSTAVDLVDPTYSMLSSRLGHKGRCTDAEIDITVLILSFMNSKWQKKIRSKQAELFVLSDAAIDWTDTCFFPLGWKEKT